MPTIIAPGDPQKREDWWRRVLFECSNCKCKFHFLGANDKPQKIGVDAGDYREPSSPYAEHPCPNCGRIIKVWPRSTRVTSGSEVTNHYDR
jgi:predicted RNA-binding Zn-ribbon protein involved in translation (DUF1610 family)